MLISEFIKFLDSVNTSTIYTKYYYKNRNCFKYELYELELELESIKFTVSYNEMCDKDIQIYSTDYNNNYNQQQFFNTLRAIIPNGSFICTLNIYIN